MSINDLRGNTRKQKPQPPLEAASLEAPKWLDKTAKAYWRKIAPALHDSGLLNVANAEVLAAICQQFSLYREAQWHIQETGRVITSKTGVVKFSPWHQAEQQAYHSILRGYKDLGINSKEVLPMDDALDKFLNDD